MDSQDKIKLGTSTEPDMLKNSVNQTIEAENKDSQNQSEANETENPELQNHTTAKEDEDTSSPTPYSDPNSDPTVDPNTNSHSNRETPTPKKRGRKKKVVSQPKEKELTTDTIVESPTVKDLENVENVKSVETHQTRQLNSPESSGDSNNSNNSNNSDDSNDSNDLDGLDDLDEPLEKNPNLPTEGDLEALKDEDWDISLKSEENKSDTGKPELWDDVEDIKKVEANLVNTSAQKIEGKKKISKQKAKIKEPTSKSSKSSKSSKTSALANESETAEEKPKTVKTAKTAKTAKTDKTTETSKPSPNKKNKVSKSKKEVKPISIADSLKKDTATKKVSAPTETGKETIEEEKPPIKTAGLSEEQIKNAKRIGVILGVLLAGAALTAMVALNFQKIKEATMAVFPSWGEVEKPLILGDDPPIPMETPKEINGADQSNSKIQEDNLLWAESNVGMVKESTAKIKILPQNRGLKSASNNVTGQTSLPTKESQFCVIDAEIDRVIPSDINPKKRYISIIHPDDSSNRIILESSTQALVKLLDNKSIKSTDKARITLGAINPRVKSRYVEEVKSIATLLGSKEAQSYSVEEYQITSKDE